MLLSVFSFSPSASGASEMQAETTIGAGNTARQPGQDFAAFVRANQSAQATGDAQLAASARTQNTALDAILAEFSAGLNGRTELTSQQLQAMAASVDAVLVQTSAASYPASLVDALENISATLNELAEALPASDGEAKTISFEAVVAEVVKHAPETQASLYSEHQATLALINGDAEAPLSVGAEDEALPQSLFSDLQSNLSANDDAYSEPLNALLALYQAPETYHEAVQSVGATIATSQQASPRWVQHAQAVDVDVPEITLPAQVVAAAEAEANASVASGEKTAVTASTNAGVASQATAQSAAKNADVESVFEDIDQAAAGLADDASPEEVKQYGQRKAAETLAPLSQFAQALQADASAPITQAAFAPVVEAQSAITNASYNASGEVNVPRGVVSDQVHVALKHANAEGLQRITIQLDPHELGRIDVRMETDRDGAMRIAFTADRPETLDMLQREARVLERVLQDSGMKTDAGNMEFHLRNQPDQQHAGGQFNGGQGDGYEAGAEGDAELEQTAKVEAELADELAALGTSEHTSHDVHYGVNVQV